MGAMTYTAYRVLPPFDFAALLRLIQTEFAYMDGRIDPPSSMHQLTPADISSQAVEQEIWAIGHPVIACVFLTRKQDALYVGKLAVDGDHRGRGLARHLIGVAADRARKLGLSRLELQVRVELTENQRAFAALGFSEIGRTSHAGYGRPTSITMSRVV